MSEGRAYRVTGRVQGVGFRWFTSRTARHLGLTGTVRNEADGSVRVEAWGALSDLARLESFLAKGPPGARVESVDALSAPGGPAPPSFEIAR